MSTLGPGNIPNSEIDSSSPGIGQPGYVLPLPDQNIANLSDQQLAAVVQHYGLNSVDIPDQYRYTQNQVSNYLNSISQQNQQLGSGMTIPTQESAATQGDLDALNQELLRTTRNNNNIRQQSLPGGSTWTNQPQYNQKPQQMGGNPNQGQQKVNPMQSVPGLTPQTQQVIQGLQGNQGQQPPGQGMNQQQVQNMQQPGPQTNFNQPMMGQNQYGGWAKGLVPPTIPPQQKGESDGDYAQRRFQAKLDYNQQQQRFWNQATSPQQATSSGQNYSQNPVPAGITPTQGGDEPGDVQITPEIQQAILDYHKNGGDPDKPVPQYILDQIIKNNQSDGSTWQ